MKRMTLVLIALAAFSAQAGQVYKWTDKNGRVHYGDKPQAAKAEKVEIKTPGASAASLTPEQSDEAARVARLCQEKREQLQTYQTASKVIERDGLGKEKTYTDEERQQLIARTQQQIEQYCSGNPPPAQQQAQRPAPPPEEPKLVEPLRESENGR